MILVITSRNGDLDIKINMAVADLSDADSIDIDFEHTSNVIYTDDLKTKLLEFIKTLKVKE